MTASGRKGAALSHAPDFVDIPPCHKRHPRRHTERRIAVSVREGDPIFSESIHMRRLNERMSVRTAIHRCVFIGHDDEKIGLLF